MDKADENNEHVGQVIRGRSKEFSDVREFHQKFGMLCHDVPVHLSQRKLGERIAFMHEELYDEFAAAMNANDMAGMADALIDIVYVAMGTAVQMGLPWDWLWDDVHRANMAKVRGMTKRGNKVDVMKPEGWVGPQTERILQIAGYRKDEWVMEQCELDLAEPKLVLKKEPIDDPEHS